MKPLLQRYFFPALVFTTLGEIALFRFFEFGPQHIIAGVVLTSLLACTAMEYVIPENRAWNYFTHASGMRWWMFGRELASMVFSSAFTAPLRSMLCAWIVLSISAHRGSPSLASVPALAQLVLLFIGIDFIRYWVHRAQHSFRPLWRFHSTHHMMNGFAALRSYWIHPVDDLMFYAPEVSLVLILGIDSELAAVFWSVDAALQICNHSNLDIQPGWLGKVLMHPRHHVRHHAIDSGARDSVNFGEVLTLWDRVFGTFRTGPVPADFTLGILPVKARSGWHQMLAPLTRRASEL
jgi:sterol desaturase/sphingolipid hydroxylase (fatty acid hydroxylase superfamily)